MFKVMFVDPALQPLPDGHYGEMYGPITYFKGPVYLLLSLIFILGLGLLILDQSQKKDQSKHVK